MENNIRVKQEFIYNFADCVADYLYSLAENILYLADRINRKSNDQEILKITQTYKKKLMEESIDGKHEEDFFE